MIESDEEFCCHRYFSQIATMLYPKDKALFYKNATKWMFHAWWTRTIVVMIAKIVAEIPGKIANIIYLMLTFVAFLIIFFAISNLVNLCKYIYAFFLSVFTSYS